MIKICRYNYYCLGTWPIKLGVSLNLLAAVLHSFSLCTFLSCSQKPKTVLSSNVALRRTAVLRSTRFMFEKNVDSKLPFLDVLVVESPEETLNHMMYKRHGTVLEQIVQLSP